MLLTILAYFFTKISHVILFWVAFVLTRPFDATFGDLLTEPVQKGGLNFGTIGSSIMLSGILFILVIYSILKMRSREGRRNQTI